MESGISMRELVLRKWRYIGVNGNILQFGVHFISFLLSKNPQQRRGGEVYSSKNTKTYHLNWNSSFVSENHSPGNSFLFPFQLGVYAFLINVEASTVELNRIAPKINTGSER